MDEIHIVFVQEAREQIAALEAGLMAIEQGDRDPETINAIFRAAHTIKGGAGVVELGSIETFTHSMENALDRVRNGELELTPALILLLLSCCDQLSGLLDAIEGGGSGDEPAIATRSQALTEELKAYLGAGVAQTTAALATESADSVESSGGGKVATDTWHISVRFGPGVLRQGMDPQAFLRHLLTLGEIAHITTLFDAMPAAAEMDPESCYLGFEIGFRSHAEKTAIERVFDFVKDDCELHILPPNSKLDDYLKLIGDCPRRTCAWAKSWSRAAH